jgi:hypothetical protein
MEKKIAIIKNWIEDVASDDDLVSVVNSVTCWNGALGEYNFYWMEDLDELFGEMRLTEFLDKLAPNFNTGHDGFRETIYGIESCDISDVADDIKDNAEEIAEAIAEAMEETDLYLPSSLEDELAEEE